jgi:signal transduction histidine kinase
MSDSELNFQLFFAESPDELLVLLPDSPRFTIVAATKARLISTHSTAEQIIGRGLFELFPDNPHPSARANLRASLERVLATKAPDTMAVQKYDIPLSDGSFEVRYWSPRNIPILCADGRVIYILHRAVDVTDLTRAREEGEELRDRSAGMERNLAQVRHQCTADLELANRELDAFSYSVAHDLRGPLRSIDGFSEMLLKDNADQLDDEGRRRLNILRDAAQRMSRSIEDLLQLSKMSRSQVRRVPFELSSLVRTVAMQIQEGERARSVTLKVTEGVNVNADPHLLQIVLDNLLRNAWKFTARRDAAEVEFGTELVDGESCYYIRDNGAGFNMGYASKLFGIFQRLHPESEFQGAGVGLATVKRIIGRHGGRVWARGEVNRGATFYFTLDAAPSSLGQSSTVP